MGHCRYRKWKACQWMWRCTPHDEKYTELKGYREIGEVLGYVIWLARIPKLKSLNGKDANWLDPEGLPLYVVEQQARYSVNQSIRFEHDAVMYTRDRRKKKYKKDCT